MADPKDELKKKIAAIKAQISKEQAAGKDPKKDPTCRQLRKTLKRAQRKLTLLTTLTVEQRQARVAALTEMVNKRMGEINQGGKQSQGNPYVHSLRKKMKALNKRKKHLDRVVKKMQAKKAPAPAPAAAPASAAAAAPAAESK